ncbi:hypothetical protein [Oceanobacillus halotolerans]|nr:hypothetical protein [Oceanobacillus halotolerans]
MYIIDQHRVVAEGVAATGIAALRKSPRLYVNTNVITTILQE